MRFIYHNSFANNFKKLCNANIYLKFKILFAINLLQMDYTDGRLHYHKLHGNLKNLYSCYVDYNYRIVFTLKEIKDEMFIVLINIGKQDELY